MCKNPIKFGEAVKQTLNGITHELCPIIKKLKIK